MDLDNEDIEKMAYGKLEKPFCLDPKKFSVDALCCFAPVQLFPDYCAYFSGKERLCGFWKERS